MGQPLEFLEAEKKAGFFVEPRLLHRPRIMSWSGAGGVDVDLIEIDGTPQPTCLEMQKFYRLASAGRNSFSH